MAAYRAPAHALPRSPAAKSGAWTHLLDDAIGRSRSVRGKLVAMAFIYSVAISLGVFALLARGFGAAWDYLPGGQHPASFALVFLLLFVSAGLAAGALDFFLIRPLRALGDVNPDASLGEMISRFFNRHATLQDQFARLATEVGTLSEERTELSARITELATRADWSTSTVQAVMSLTRDRLVLTDAGGRIQDITPAAQELVGLDRARALGKPFDEAVTLYDLEEADALKHPLSGLMTGVISRGATMPNLSHALFVDANGNRHPLYVSAAAVAGQDGGIVAGVCRLQPMEEDFPSTDGSADVADTAGPEPERPVVRDSEVLALRADALIEDARRNRSAHALLLLSVDGLDAVCDRFGHAAGASLQWEVGRILEECVGARGECFRATSTHSAALLKDTGRKAAVSVAEAVRTAVDGREFKRGDRRYDATVSIAVVPITADSEGGGTLMEHADETLIAAKVAGGNRVQVHEADGKVAQRRRADEEWSTWLTRHLNQGRVHLISQEIRPLTAGLAPMLEMLVRVEADDGGWESPGLFLPALVRRDLMAKMDLQLIKRVVAALAHNRDAVSGYGTLCVNLSGTSIGKPRFAELVANVLVNAGVPPARIGFEVDAADVISQPADFARFVQVVRATGAVFALDRCKAAVGLNALNTLPIEYVKIHPSLVDRATRDPLDRAYVEWIQRAVKLFGRKTVATGVQNEAALELARVVGVDYVQGMHINRLGPLII